jgi:hypothetical protein
MLIKTPTFPLTLVMLVAAFTMAVVADWMLTGNKATARKLLKTGGLVLAIALLVAAPAYVTHLREILAYIYAPTFGEKKEIWRTAGDTMFQLRFYVDGEGGRAMLGRHLYLLPAIIAAGIASAAVLRQFELLTRTASLLVVAAAAYLVPTILTVKQPFFGTSFDWMAIFTSLYLLVWLCREVNYIAGGVALGIVLGAGLLIAQFIPPMYEAASPVAAARRRVIEGLSLALRAQEIDPRTRIYITTTGYVNADVLNFMALQRMLPPMHFEQKPGIGDLKVHAREIKEAAYVIASEQGNSEAMGGFLAAGNIQDQTLALVRSDSEFEQIAEFPTLTGKRYFLFHRERFAGVDAVSGLGPIEGPYPRWGLDKVKWGNGPRSVTHLSAPADGEYKLMTEGRAAVAGARMTLSIDGHPAGSHVFETNSRFEREEFMFHLAPGSHELELDYSDWDRAGGQSRAVLFDLLKLVRTDAH